MLRASPHGLLHAREALGQPPALRNPAWAGPCWPSPFRLKACPRQPAKPGSDGSGSILSPAEAHAATLPPAATTPKPVQPKGKQAKPEAFDPF